MRNSKPFPAKLPDRTSDSSRAASNLNKLHLLVLDQNTPIRKACCEIAEALELTVTEAASLDAARDILRQKGISILLLDVTHPEDGNQAFLKEIKINYPEISIIAMSSHASIADVVEIMRSGASDYLSKPFPLNVLTEALARAGGRWHFGIERRNLQETLKPHSKIVDALGQSAEMEKLYRTLSNVADSMHPVMILGESGTGKTLVAESIHFNSRQSSKPFVSLDCASLGPTLLEDMLFGANQTSVCKAEKMALLASHRGGTIFLDEIGDLPLDLQGKLMKALVEKEIFPRNETKAIRISVRVVAATSRDLMQMVRDGLFRMDLYRLLSVVNLRIPPLRGRPDDIAFLTKRFLEKIHQQTGISRTLSKETLEMLETYDWPDNVQELEDTIAHACSQLSGPELEPIHLPRKLLRFHRNMISQEGASSHSTLDPDNLPRKHTVIPIAKVEEHAILDALRETNGDKLRAAELLGIGKTTMYRKLKEYGVVEDSRLSAGLSSPVSSANVKETQPVLTCA